MVSNGIYMCERCCSQISLTGTLPGSLISQNKFFCRLNHLSTVSKKFWT